MDLSGEDNVHSDSDIVNDVGMVGDDFHEMIEKYSKQFSVDLSDYLWYYHCGEEGVSIGAIFFNPPNLRVKRIPVTPNMLTEYANKGKWNFIYPDTKLPKRRYDILINQVVVGLFISVLLFWAIIKLIN